MSMISEQVKELRELANSKEFEMHEPVTYGFYRKIKSKLFKAADTIEALSARLQVANGSGWISCEDALPKEGVKVLVWFEYFRYGKYNRLFQTKGISYTFNGKWSGFVNGSSGWRELRIIAWQPMPEDFRP